MVHILHTFICVQCTIFSYIIQGTQVHVPYHGTFTATATCNLSLPFTVKTPVNLPLLLLLSLQPFTVKRHVLGGKRRYEIITVVVPLLHSYRRIDLGVGVGCLVEFVSFQLCW